MNRRDEWAVTGLAHPALRDVRENCQACLAQVETAITYAKATGSRGATYSDDDKSDSHSATVARIVAHPRSEHLADREAARERVRAFLDAREGLRSLDDTITGVEEHTLTVSDLQRLLDD